METGGMEATTIGQIPTQVEALMEADLTLAMEETGTKEVEATGMEMEATAGLTPIQEEAGIMEATKMTGVEEIIMVVDLIPAPMAEVAIGAMETAG